MPFRLRRPRLGKKDPRPQAATRWCVLAAFAAGGNGEAAAARAQRAREE